MCETTAGRFLKIYAIVAHIYIYASDSKLENNKLDRDKIHETLVDIEQELASLGYKFPRITNGR